MFSKFDDPLELSSDRRTITAAGPLKDWKPSDADHCKITAKLTQGTLSATCRTGSYGRGNTSWDCKVDAPNGAHWDPDAPVHCHGEIEMSGPPPADPWPDQDVDLKVKVAAPA
jgi:hypothetical protein